MDPKGFREQKLSLTPFLRAYRTLLNESISEEDLAALRAYLQQQRAYGRDDFRAMVEAKTKRFASVRPAHRPAKSGDRTG